MAPDDTTSSASGDGHGNVQVYDRPALADAQRWLPYVIGVIGLLLVLLVLAIALDWVTLDGFLASASVASMPVYESPLH